MWPSRSRQGQRRPTVRNWRLTKRSRQRRLARTDPEGFSDEPNDAGEVQAPPIAPDDFEDSRPPIDVDAGQRATLPEDIETVAARRQGRAAATATQRWPLSLLHTGILALVLIDAIVIGWREGVVRALPQTAPFYALLGMPVNLRGLTFDSVATKTEEHEGVPILVVEGNIVEQRAQSRGRTAVEVHRSQRRAAGDLFLDCGSFAHVAAAGRGCGVPQPPCLTAARRARPDRSLRHPPRLHPGSALANGANSHR